MLVRNVISSFFELWIDSRAEQANIFVNGLPGVAGCLKIFFHEPAKLSNDNCNFFRRKHEKAPPEIFDDYFNEKLFIRKVFLQKLTKKDKIPLFYSRMYREDAELKKGYILA